MSHHSITKCVFLLARVSKLGIDVENVNGYDHRRIRERPVVADPVACSGIYETWSCVLFSRKFSMARTRASLSLLHLGVGLPGRASIS
jgi:hypothetical protein